MQQYRMPPLPDVTKNLIIINVIMFIITLMFSQSMSQSFAIYPIQSQHFQPYQVVTHMFMHGSVMHIFFNMFALYMFGRDVEYSLGPKRFLIFYLITGFGAVILHQFAGYIEFQYYVQDLPQEIVNSMLAQDEGQLNEIINTTYRGQLDMDKVQSAYDVITTPAVGASGAIYGVLAAFGMLYPNRMIMLLIPPIPMKAKYFVLIMGAISLYLGISGRMGGVAHFAHLGGAIFGVLLIWYWRQKGVRF